MVVLKCWSSEMRAFLALEVTNEAVLSSIAKAQRRFLETEADLKIVESKNLHFTLRFFGEVSEDQVNCISHNLDDLDTESVNVNFEGVGVFPNPRRISVIYVGVDKGSYEKIVKISQEVENRIKGIVGVADKMFKPHLTISRVRTNRNKEKLQRVVNELRSKRFGNDILNEIKLKKSELTSKGPIYSNLCAIPLKEEQVL